MIGLGRLSFSAKVPSNLSAGMDLLIHDKNIALANLQGKCHPTLDKRNMSII